MKATLKETILWFCILLFINGVISVVVTFVTKGYPFPHDFLIFSIWSIQQESLLFIPLILYFGYEYRNRLNNNILNFTIIPIFILITVIFGYYNPQAPFIATWGIFITFSFIVFIKAKFNTLFAFSLSYLLFLVGNTYFALSFDFNQLTLYYYLFAPLVMLIIILYKLNVKLKIKDFIIIICSIFPIIFSWIYFYSIWSVWYNDIVFTQKITPIQPIIRLFTFPLLIVITIYIYKNEKIKNEF
jgi:hypothetical protein